jgi:hypothetical protein
MGAPIWPQVGVVVAALVLLAGCGADFATRVEQREISATAFGPSQLSLEHEHARITRTAEDGPVGVMMRQGSRGWGRRMLIRAEAGGEIDTSVRFVDRGRLRYEPIPAGGDITFVLDDQVTEALFYQSEAASVDITFTKIAECRPSLDACYTREDLRLDALGEAAPQDEFGRMVRLLNWAANAADYALTADLAEQSSRLVDIHAAPQMYSIVYRNNAGGGYCGVTAVFFTRMLRELGYEAARIDFGVADTALTHVTTLARNPADGEFYLLDPTFNFYFVRRDTGAPATFREVLTLSPSALDVRTFPMQDRDYLASAAGYRRVRDAVENCRLNWRRNIYVCKQPDFGLDTYIAENAAGMATAGYSADREGFIMMLRGRYFRVTGPEPTRQAVLDLLDGAGVEPPRRH